MITPEELNDNISKYILSRQVSLDVINDDEYNIVIQDGIGDVFKTGSYDRYVVFKNNIDTDFLVNIFSDAGLIQVSCNPFKDKTIDMCGMIEYHDECQLAVNPKLIQYKIFKTEEELKDFENAWEGEQLGSAVEGKNGTFVIALPNPVSKAITKAIDMAVEEVKLKVPLACEWVVHKNWYGCH